MPRLWVEGRAVVPKVIWRLSQYGEQRSSELPPHCVHLLTGFQMMAPRHCPYGIVDFLDGQTKAMLSSNFAKMSDSIVTLEKLGAVVLDRKSKLLFVEGTFGSHIFQNPTPREVGYWRKFTNKFKSSPAIEAWEKDLKSNLNKMPIRARRAICSHFFPDMDISKQESNPDGREIIEYFSSKFNELGYGKYIPNWARDIQIVNSMLDSIEKEELKLRMDKYFGNEWYMENQGADLKRFQSLINRFASRENANSNSESPGSSYWDIVKNKQKANNNAS